ncbi:MAG TPA: hypothetical protein VMU92_06730, partial [Acidobacteriaceae bacterium]|nr:hypothetical protein [Acidobacteriaceae bacterium]
PSGSLPKALQHPINTGQTCIANRFHPGRSANRQERRYDAANFNEFLGRFWFLLLVVAASAVGLGFACWHRASWAVCLAWLGVCIIGFAILKASTQVVTAAASQTKLESINARSNWFALLQSLQLQADNSDVRQSLERFAEKVQFAANESHSAEPGENREIDAVLGQLKSNLSRPDEVSRLLCSAEVLLAQREHSLRAERTSA